MWAAEICRRSSERRRRADSAGRPARHGAQTAEREGAAGIGHGGCARDRAGGGAGAKLRRPGDEAGGDAGTEYAESEQRKRRQEEAHRGSDVDRPGERGRELAENGRADADDDRKHHHLDAGGDHIAERLLGEEGSLSPQREGNQDEARERRQLELDQGDEQLDREDEEGEDGENPAEQQDQNRRQIGQGVEAGELAGFFQQRVRRRKSRGGNKARPHEIGGRKRPARRLQADGRKGAKDNVGERTEIADDEGKGANIEDFLGERDQDGIVGAQRPGETRQRYIDGDKGRAQESDIAAEQAEAGIDIARERLGEAVDDRKVGHGALPYRRPA